MVELNAFNAREYAELTVPDTQEAQAQLQKTVGIQDLVEHIWNRDRKAFCPASRPSHENDEEDEAVETEVQYGTREFFSLCYLLYKSTPHTHTYEVGQYIRSCTTGHCCLLLQ